MAEATLGYQPLQATRSQPASVGTIPEIPQDDSFNTIQKYATKLNMGNIKEARQEQFLNGQVLAAQNDGVAEVRRDTPAIAKIFGGGAELSGAMAHMEATRMLEYKESINDDMENLRQLRPEDFKNKQMDEIKNHMTDDDETNAKIMQSFNLALPDVARVQAKAHEGFVQEEALSSMTTFSVMALRAVQKSTDESELARNELFLKEHLKQSEDMDDDAYKQFLYGFQKHSAAQGDLTATQMIQDLGLVNSPTDLEAMGKAETAYFKYDAQQQVVAFGVAHAALEQTAEDLEVPYPELITQVEALNGKYGLTEPQIKAIVAKRLKAQEDAKGVVDTQENVDLLLTGDGKYIPTGQQQAAAAVVYEQTEKDPALFVPMLEGLNKTTTVSNAMKNDIQSQLVNAVQENEDGTKSLTVGASHALEQLETLKALQDETHTNIYDRHVSKETAVLHAAVTKQQRRAPEKQPWQWVAAATEQIANDKVLLAKIGGVPIRHTKDDVAKINDVLIASGKFTEEGVKNPLVRTIVLNVMSKGLHQDPELYAAEVQSEVARNIEEVRDGYYVPTIDGKSLAQRTGMEDSITKVLDYASGVKQGWLERMKGSMGMNTPNIYAGRRIKAIVDGTKPQFRIVDIDTNEVIGNPVSFKELDQWNKEELEAEYVRNTTAERMANLANTNVKGRRKMEKAYIDKHRDDPRSFSPDGKKIIAQEAKEYADTAPIEEVNTFKSPKENRRAMETELAEGYSETGAQMTEDEAREYVYGMNDEQVLQWLTSQANDTTERMRSDILSMSEEEQNLNLLGYGAYAALAVSSMQTDQANLDAAVHTQQAIAIQGQVDAGALVRDDVGAVEDLAIGTTQTAPTDNPTPKDLYSTYQTGGLGTVGDGYGGRGDIAAVIKDPNNGCSDRDCAMGIIKDKYIQHGRLHATGRDQVIGSTHVMNVKRRMAGMTVAQKKDFLDGKYDEAYQQDMFENLLVTKQEGVKKYVDGGTDKAAAFAGLRTEWVGLGVHNGEPGASDAELLVALDALKETPRNTAPLRALIDTHEGGGDWNAYNLGSITLDEDTAYDADPRVKSDANTQHEYILNGPAMDITGMTIRQVLLRQSAFKSWMNTEEAP